jgi:hypothetical protein
MDHHLVQQPRPQALPSDIGPWQALLNDIGPCDSTSFSPAAALT